MKYKTGDYVAVRAKVFSNNGDNGNNTLTCSFHAPGALHSNVTFSVSIDDIIAHYPEPIKVGDIVKPLYESFTYTVIGIDGDTAWLKHKDGFRITMGINDMERV